MIEILIPVIAYLLGSIPTAVLISKYFYGIDVREKGSGNAGATNTFRILGAKAAIPVLFIDILKGFLAVKLILISGLGHQPEALKIQMLSGILASLGHIFPVFAKFRGGKGVATLTGVVLAIEPNALLFALPVFILTVLITRFVSLGSILATVSLPFVFLFILHLTRFEYLVFSLIIITIVIFTHWKNILRLMEGKENAFSLNRKSHDSK